MLKNPILKIIAGPFLLVASIGWAESVPKADLDASKLRPTVQKGTQALVVEGASDSIDLKDVPVSKERRVLELLPYELSGDEFAILKDVEILTGIPSSGFDQPVASQERGAKR